MNKNSLYPPPPHAKGRSRAALSNGSTPQPFALLCSATACTSAAAGAARSASSVFPICSISQKANSK
jgi:hypothetical protein